MVFVQKMRANKALKAWVFRNSPLNSEEMPYHDSALLTFSEQFGENSELLSKRPDKSFLKNHKSF
ncbi:MAG: hypothetical protein IJ113_01190 [Eggerthellaceae bacterium]|nr:hypothetical protein [Eggerthellaceae bacterium]